MPLIPETIKRVRLLDIYVALRSLLNALYQHPVLNPVGGSVKVTQVNWAGREETLGAVGTVTTVTTVGTMTQVGGIAAKEAMIDMQLIAAWQLGIRGRIT